MRDKVFQIVSRVMGVPVERITEESSPASMERWDSLKHMNLLLSLEEELGVRFDDQEMVETMSVGRIVELASTRLSA